MVGAGDGKVGSQVQPKKKKKIKLGPRRFMVRFLTEIVVFCRHRPQGLFVSRKSASACCCASTPFCLADRMGLRKRLVKNVRSVRGRCGCVGGLGWGGVVGTRWVGG